ncbi:MAG: DUF1737 domain-containing protein [Chthoniobacterales bacterium]|nr:DUF1737 domain-containing protein [Chthoniobacterales bacterium]
MKYCVVTAPHDKQLSDEIERLLCDGWECQGGVCVIERINREEREYLQFSQAMIKDTQ